MSAKKMEMSFEDACRVGDIEQIKKLEQLGLDLPYRLGFQSACWSSQVEVVKYLQKITPDEILKEIQEIDNNFLMHIYMEDNSVNMAKFLLGSNEIKYNSIINMDDDKNNYVYFLFILYTKDFAKDFAKEMIMHVISNYEVNKSEPLKKILALWPEAENMFALIQLNKKLDNELEVSNSKVRLKL